MGILIGLTANILLLCIFLLLIQVRKELKHMARGVRVDSNMMAASTHELASAVRDTGEYPVLAVTEELDNHAS